MGDQRKPTVSFIPKKFFIRPLTNKLSYKFEYSDAKVAALQVQDITDDGKNRSVSEMNLNKSKDDQNVLKTIILISQSIKSNREGEKQISS